MFEFFIALFGGIFWGVKICSDISKTKAYDRNVKIVKQAYENGVAKWEAAVVDSYLENNISYKLQDASFLYATIKEMEEVLGCNYITLFPKSKKNAERYLLAKQGKLKSSDASSYGIDIIGALQGNPNDMERWDEERAFVRWIHAEIKKHGENSKLMFRDAGRYPHKEVGENEMERFSGGQFYWDAAAYSSYQRVLSPYSNK